MIIYIFFKKNQQQKQQTFFFFFPFSFSFNRIVLIYIENERFLPFFSLHDLNCIYHLQRYMYDKLKINIYI
eukprot:UN04231